MSRRQMFRDEPWRYWPYERPDPGGVRVERFREGRFPIWRDRERWPLRAWVWIGWGVLTGRYRGG